MLVVILAASKHVGQGVAQRVLTLAKRADVVELTQVLDPNGDVRHGFSGWAACVCEQRHRLR